MATYRKDLLTPVLFAEPVNVRISRQQRKKIIRQRGSKCERCGGTENLTVHHIDHDTSNNTPENEEVLCRRCHDIEDFGKVTSNGAQKND